MNAACSTSCKVDKAVGKVIISTVSLDTSWKVSTVDNHNDETKTCTGMSSWLNQFNFLPVGHDSSCSVSH